MASQLEHSADHIPMGWGGAYRHTKKKGVEGSRGASAECVSEHKLSQRQTNNNPGMQRTAQRSQGRMSVGLSGAGGGGIIEEARLE